MQNAPEGLLASLVPTGVVPDSALVCRYSGDFNPGPAPKLLRATTLGSPAARKLAAALSRVTLGFPGGAIPCASGNGSTTIIAVHYPHRSTDVDISFSISGCRSLDNGFVVAAQRESPSFDVFQSLLN